MGFDYWSLDYSLTTIVLGGKLMLMLNLMTMGVCIWPTNYEVLG